MRIVDDYTDTMDHLGAILIDAYHHLFIGETDQSGDDLAVAY